MSLSPLLANGAVPPGDHTISWKNLVQDFGWNNYRRNLLGNLHVIRQELKAKGVEKLWLDGSFVTDIHRPKDIDVVYEVPRSADLDTWGLLSPKHRARLKARAHIDLWPSTAQ